MIKKGVSLILSYVILIFIVVGLSVGVFLWMKSYTNITPKVGCKEETSIVLTNISCYDINRDGNDELVIYFKNNGRFNVSGVFLSVGEDEKKIPKEYLIADYNIAPGYYFFPSPLKPNEESNAVFLNIVKKNNFQQVNLRTIKIVQYQPFILINNQRILCTDSIKKEKIDSCI